MPERFDSIIKRADSATTSPEMEYFNKCHIDGERLPGAFFDSSSDWERVLAESPTYRTVRIPMPPIPKEFHNSTFMEGLMNSLVQNEEFPGQ